MNVLRRGAQHQVMTMKPRGAQHQVMTMKLLMSKDSLGSWIISKIFLRNLLCSEANKYNFFDLCFDIEWVKH